MDSLCLLMHTLRLSIGGLKFRLILPRPIDIGREFLPFILSETVEAYEFAGDKDNRIAKSRQGETIPNLWNRDVEKHYPDERVIASGDDVVSEHRPVEGTSTSDDNVFLRYRSVEENSADRDDVIVEYRPDNDIADAEVTVSPDASGITVRYGPEEADHFTALRGCLIYLPMDRILLAHDRFFLHASFVTSPWGGLLFSGKAGAGKSTQAELWRKHMGSTVINGDRAIVAKEAGGFRAYGSPYAGSSGYYVRRDEPIRAVILPEKASENRVERVPEAEACRKLLLQSTVDRGRTEDVVHLCDLVEELIRTVPVFRLYCTADERAVEALRGTLEQLDFD